MEQVVEGVRLLHAQGHTGPIGCAQALSAEADAQRMLALPKDAKFAPEGRPRKEPEGNPDIVRVNADTGGNSAAYLAARLKKAERDDLLAEIGPGKRYSSVRAAAIEAGIIRPVPTIRLVDDVSRVAASITKHLPPDQVQALSEALLASLNPSPAHEA